MTSGDNMTGIYDLIQCTEITCAQTGGLATSIAKTDTISESVILVHC